MMIQQGSNNGEEDQVTLYLEWDGGEFALPPGGWLRLLTLPQQHGCCPTGTEAPEYPWAEDSGSGLMNLDD